MRNCQKVNKIDDMALSSNSNFRLKAGKKYESFLKEIWISSYNWALQINE